MKKGNVHPLYNDVCQFDNVIGLGHGHKWIRGINTRQEAVVILVRKKMNRHSLSRSALVPGKLDGMVTDIIEVGDICLHTERKKLLRPAPPGVSIGHYKVSAGTFGAVVRDRNSNELFILSNNHVLANLTDGKDERSRPGDLVLQPGSFDNMAGANNSIATLKKFIPVYRELNRSECNIAHIFEKLINKMINTFKPQYRIQVLRNNEQVNLVDCAIAAPVHSEDISPEILEIGAIAGIKEASLGLQVKKSGRSSGVTHSIVLATDVSMKVNISRQESAVFADQILAGPMSMPGDSGSVILTEDNYAVGLLFAGSEQATMFNRITNVLDALNVDLILDK
ncbi:hypothetical protein HSX37_02030|uniref:Trypsin-like peptidase domain-containing protein n=1 Tax=Dendrosporobacter quercicolus TaxID=146817 RepID=A0A1G9LUS7_9FIRM|nr:hypothetical protein [Dendrosporobacter quercicolus]NSL46835.1 hypothetical protein [Dendrosporobacter quercicolus DSM 1736]SDL65688.1 hypothetical protein SAMN04488502_101474 [Dendrosporobacter quercicolus]